MLFLVRKIAFRGVLAASVERKRDGISIGSSQASPIVMVSLWYPYGIVMVSLWYPGYHNDTITIR